eukprot:SAG11_NODE_2477_length_3313_cov_2.275980_2_plen_83_part_00
MPCRADAQDADAPKDAVVELLVAQVSGTRSAERETEKRERQRQKVKRSKRDLANEAATKEAWEARLLKEKVRHCHLDRIWLS